MKFRDEFNNHQNKMAWQEHSLNAPRTDYDSLNEGERTWLRSLNDQLRQLEDKYSPIMNDKLQDFQARIADPSEWMLLP